jgi:hypothetical protein
MSSVFVLAVVAVVLLVMGVVLLMLAVSLAVHVVLPVGSLG